MTAEDNEGVRELLAKYCHYVDAGNAEAWAGLFVDDGTLVLNLGGPPIEGKKAIYDFASRLGSGTSMHLSLNPLIAADGDRATVESYVVVVGGEDPGVRLGGRYEDQVRRTDGGWRFVRRELHPVFTR